MSTREDFYIQSGLRDLPERAIVELAYLVTMREVAHPELRSFFKRTLEIYSRRKLEEGGIDHSADLPEMEDIGGEYMFKSNVEDEPAPPPSAAPRPVSSFGIITLDDDDEEAEEELPPYRSMPDETLSSHIITINDSPEKISSERKMDDSSSTISEMAEQTCNLTPPDSTFQTESPKYGSETSNYPSPQYAPYSPGDSLSPQNEKPVGGGKSPENEPYDPASPGYFSLSPINVRPGGGGETPEYEPLSPQYGDLEEILNQSRSTSRAADPQLQQQHEHPTRPSSSAAGAADLSELKQSRTASRAASAASVHAPQQTHHSRPSSRAAAAADQYGMQQARQSRPPSKLQQTQSPSRPATPSERVMQQSRLNSLPATASPQLRKRPHSQDVPQWPPVNPAVQQLPLTPQLSNALSRLQLLQQAPPMPPVLPPAMQHQQLPHRPNVMSLPNFSVPPLPLPPLHMNPLLFPLQGFPPFIPPPPIVQPHEIPLPPQNQNEWFLCPFCWSPHSPENCDEYPTAAQREKRQRELILCVHCLGKHPKRVCHVREHERRCTNCGKHSTHIALCRAKYSK